MNSFADLAMAMRMRDLVTSISTDLIKRMRPEARIGKVYMYDKTTQLAQIYFPGENISSLLTVQFALDKIPSVQMADRYASDGLNAPGDVVRIAGTPGAYYIADFVAGVPQDFEGFDTPVSVVYDPHMNPKFDVVEMSTAANGSSGPETARLIPSNWHGFWGSGNASFQASTETSKGAGYSTQLIVPTGEYQRWQSSVFSVLPGQILRLKVQVKTNGLQTEIGFQTADGNPDFFSSDPTTNHFAVFAPATDNIYREIVTTAVVPAGHTSARVHLGAGTGNGSMWFDETQVTVEEAPPAYVPSGAIFQWPTATPSSGYLLCNGSTFSSVDEPILAAVLGDTFGTHTGTTYYLPDYRGRSPVGVGAPGLNTGGASAGTYTHILGGRQGEERTTLTAAQSGSPAHQHPYHVGYSESLGNLNWILGRAYDGTDRSIWLAASHTTDLSTAVNASQSHNSVHPVLATNFVIKT